MSLSTLNQYWESYLQQLDKKPVQTKALTAATLSAVSDVIAQLMTGASISTLNLTSIRHQALIGLIIRGPFVHFWFQAMEKIFAYAGVKPADQNATPVVVGKVAMDQLLFSAPFTALYFYAIGLLQNMPLADIQGKISRDLWPLMIANWKVWPILNLLIFRFVPAQLQVLVGNILSVFWMVYVIKSTAGK